MKRYHPIDAFSIYGARYSRDKVKDGALLASLVN